MSTVHATRLRAPAKLTLSLRVTGRRADGLHLLDAEMVTLDLADDLALTPLSASARGPGNLELVDADGASRTDLPSGADNLVSRALAAVGRRADVVVTKRIPAGGGLGGGSADAAAVLRWAGCRDLALAATIGADVPFCLVGGRARVRGVGELVTPLPYVERAVTLALSSLACPTPAVYAAWDRLGGPTGDGPNDLEPAALAVEPRLAAVRDRLAEQTGRRPVLAGSGATWFVEGAYPGPGRVVARTVPAAATAPSTAPATTSVG